MNHPFEIHVHGDVLLRSDVTYLQLQEALRPMWSYSGARSLESAAVSHYPEEPGILFDAGEHRLRVCWTVCGDTDFRHHLDEMCMALNELTDAAAPIEVSFYDTEYDDMDEDEGDEPEQSRDDFVMLFVGPNPQAILQVQRDMLINDVVNLMERHFDASELEPVIAAIDGLFEQRYTAMVNSLDISRIIRGPSGPAGHGGHGSGRKPRHLH